MIRLSRLRYCGYVLRMKDGTLPKQRMYSEVDLGERSRGHPKQNFRGCVKDLKFLECGRVFQNKHCNDAVRQKQLEDKGQLRGLFTQITWEIKE